MPQNGIGWGRAIGKVECSNEKVVGKDGIHGGDSKNEDLTVSVDVQTFS